MKIIRIIMIILFFPSAIFSAVLEVPFSKENKGFFYLNQSILDSVGVEIAPETTKYSTESKNYTLINFEKEDPSFHQVNLVKDAKVEKMSGLFFSPNSSVNFKFDQSLENGLAIEFWAKPLSTIKGRIFSIQFLTESGIEKEIAILLDRGRLKVNFQNMFITNSGITQNKTISLTSDSKILPDIWVHHRITYTPNDGKISYYYNNAIDGEIWATETLLPGSSILYLDVPQFPRMILGGDYRGLIDQFIIGTDPKHNFSNRIIGYDTGFIYTHVMALPEKSSINAINLDIIKPTDTDAIIEYRIANTPFNANTPPEIVPWHEYNTLKPEKNLPMIGKYIQTRIHLLADPTNNYSPLVKKLLIHYSTFELPLKPIDIRIASSEGNLIISLNKSINKSVTAYKIYIGVNPDNYLGDISQGIASPLIIPISQFQYDATTKRLIFVLPGLTPYKLYYMKLTAITSEGVESPFSDIVKTRIRTLV